MKVRPMARCLRERRDALKTYQQENNLPQTGDLDARTAASLG